MDPEQRRANKEVFEQYIISLFIAQPLHSAFSGILTRNAL